MDTEPLFKTILGSDWQNLGSVVRRHYFLKGNSNDYICVSGLMEEIHHSLYAKLLIPFGVLFGAIVPFKGSLNSRHLTSTLSLSCFQLGAMR